MLSVRCYVFQWHQLVGTIPVPDRVNERVCNFVKCGPIIKNILQQDNGNKLNLKQKFENCPSFGYVF